MGKIKAVYKKMKELANPDYSKRITGRDKIITGVVQKATGIKKKK